MHGLAIGQRFERYHVLRALGSGVSGISYEAEDLMLHHTVTLKLIHPWSTLADPARRQFFRDMQSISLLVHPYHAAMHDYGEVEGQLYVARRFVNHGSLLSSEGRSWFSPPFTISDTLSYARQLAEILYKIHQYGYIHGSLTLSNILVLHGPKSVNETDFAPFLLSDIGLAYFVRRFGHPQITRLPITAAPEQWKGLYTPASDQYALAVLIYLWLAGRPPFIGSPEEIEQAKHKASFPVLSSFNPQITLEQEGIMRRALSAHPEARYPNILSFIEAIQTSLTRQAKPLQQAQAYAPSSPVVTEPLMQPTEEITPLTEYESNGVQSPDENDIMVPTHNTKNGTVEPITSTFLMDQDAILLLTAMARGEKPQPEVTPKMKANSSLSQSGQKPVPPTESAPGQSSHPSELSVPADPVAPARNIAPPLQDQTLPEAGKGPASSPATPDPSLDDPQKSTEQQQTSAKLITALIITSPYLLVPQEWHLEKEEITLGRAGSSDILLDKDQQTSRHHALLRRQGDLYYAYDQLSSHGVIVNGQKLIPGIGCPLTDGDRIYICSYTLTVHLIPAQHDHESQKEPAIL